MYFYFVYAVNAARRLVKKQNITVHRSKKASCKRKPLFFTAAQGYAFFKHACVQALWQPFNNSVQSSHFYDFLQVSFRCRQVHCNIVPECFVEYLRLLGDKRDAVSYTCNASMQKLTVAINFTAFN